MARKELGGKRVRSQEGGHNLQQNAAELPTKWNGWRRFADWIPRAHLYGAKKEKMENKKRYVANVARQK